MLWRQMFLSLAAQKTCCGNKFFLLWNKYKNIFASWTQILHTKHVFPTLVSMKTMLTSFQCCWLIKKNVSLQRLVYWSYSYMEQLEESRNRRWSNDRDRTGDSPAQKVTNRLSSVCFANMLLLLLQTFKQASHSKKKEGKGIGKIKWLKCW